MKAFSTIKGNLFYGWLVIAYLLLILTFLLGTRLSFGVFIKSLAFEFQLSRLATSAVFSTQMVLACVFSVLGGWVLDRYGPRVVFFLMGLFTGSSLLVTSLAVSTWQLFFSYSLLLAIGTSSGFSSVTATASRWFVKKRGLAVGIASSGEGLGISLMVPLAAYLITGFGWRTAFVVLALLSFFFVCGLSLLLRKDPGKMGLHPDGLEPPALHTGSRKQACDMPEGLSLPSAFRTSSFWYFFIVLFLVSFCFHLVTTHVIPYATDVGMSSPTAALILTTTGATNILGRLVVGGASDRMGRKALACFCAIFQSATLILLLCSREQWAFFLFAIGFGFGFGGLSTVSAAMIGDTFGSRSLGAITGVAVVGFYLGASVGPLVGGYVYDISNHYFIAFLTGAAMMLAAAVFITLIKKEITRMEPGISERR